MVNYRKVALSITMLALWIYCIVIFSISRSNSTLIDANITQTFMNIDKVDKSIIIIHDYEFIVNATKYINLDHKSFDFSQTEAANIFKNLKVLPIYYCKNYPSINGLSHRLCDNNVALFGCFITLAFLIMFILLMVGWPTFIFPKT